MRSVEKTLLKQLDRSLKDPLTRRALHVYSERSPTMVLLVVSCLTLTEETQVAAHQAIAAETLRRCVASDCGLYHLCREWCQLQGELENEVTEALRQNLLEDLFKALTAECQELAQSPQRWRRANHLCYSAYQLPAASGAAGQQGSSP